jgi:predicted MFS family arabinose efflux permease
MIGVVGFTATSVLSGLAQSPTMLIASRLAQGLTAALLFPQGLSMITAVFPSAERAKAFGIFAASAGIAIVFGPLAGGLIVGNALGGDAWRFIFLVNVPIGLLSLAASARFVPESRATGAHGLDLRGVAMISVGLFALVFPLLEGRDADWAPWTYASMAAGALVLAVFIGYQRRRSRAGHTALVQPTMFRERAFSVGALLAFLVFVGAPSSLFTLNLVFQAGLGFTALHAGLTTLGFSAGVLFGAIMGVRLESRIGPRGVVGLGALLGALGSAGTIVVLHAAGGSVSTPEFFAPLLALGLGFGNIAPRLLAVVLAGVRSADAGSGTGVLTTIQQVGAALGVTVVGVVLFGLLGSNARTTVAEYTPQIHSAAVAEFHVPQPQLAGFTRTFENCFVQRIEAKDPGASVPGCPAATPGLLQAPLGRVATAALATTFVRSEQTALLVNAGVFALAFVLVLALPRVSREQQHVDVAH